MAEEITKAVTIPTPTYIGTNSWDQGKVIQRKWRVGEVEDAMWQFRAAGATDDTELTFQTYGDDSGITAHNMIAWALDVPPALRRPATRYEPDPEPPRPTGLARVRASVAAHPIDTSLALVLTGVGAPFLVVLLVRAWLFAWGLL